MIKNQSQDGAEHSVNAQAGRDAVVVVQGVTASDAMEIARKVVQWELLRYQDDAVRTVIERLEEWRQALVDRVEKVDSRHLDSFRDPDVQMMLGDAQRSYARSGRDDVKRILIDLVAARCAAKPAGLQSVVINDAVEVVRKLTPAIIAALTVSFVVMHVKNNEVQDQEQLAHWLRDNVGPFLDDLPRGRHEYDYVEATRCARTSDISDLHLGLALVENYPGLFQAGISRDSIPRELLAINDSEDDEPLFIPCLNNPELLQVRALNVEQAKERMERHPVESELYVGLLGHKISHDAANEIVIKFYPEWKILAEYWKSSRIRNIRLTSIGMAVAHSNWSNRTGLDPALSIWIPEE